MIQDTEDVVARLTRFAETLSVNRHYMTGQTCMEVQEATRALLADRQSLSDRIDELRAHLFDVSIAAGKLIAAADGIEKLRPERKAALIAIDAAAAAIAAMKDAASD